MGDSTSTNIIHKLKEHSTLYLFSKILPSFFTFLCIIFFVRIAGREEYGRYSLLISIILFTLTFTNGWISQVILRFHGLYTHNKEKLYYTKTIYITSIFSCFVGIAVLYVSISNIPSTSTNVTLISLLIYIFAFVYGLKNTLLQANFKPRAIILNELIRTVLILIIPILLFLYFGYMNSIIILLGAGVAYLSAVLFRSEEFNNKKNLFKILFLKTKNIKKYFIKYIQYGIPLSLWLAMAYLLNVSDRYFIAYFTNYENVGVYSAVYDLVYKSFSLVFFPILLAAHPLIMNNWTKNKGDSIKILKKSLKYQALIFPFMLVGIIGLSPILSKLLKIENHLLLNIGIPVAVGSFLWQFSMLLHKPLELLNRTFLMLVYISLALLVNVVGNIIFIPKFGFIVAAYTTIAGAFMYIFLVTLSFVNFAAND